MISQGRSYTFRLARRILADDNSRVVSVGINCDFWFQQIDAGGLQPLLRPGI